MRRLTFPFAVLIALAVLSATAYGFLAYHVAHLR